MIQIEASIQAAKAPTNWDASRASRPNVTTVSWSAYDSSNFINPGSSLNDFRYTSTGLPKIQTFYAVGRVAPPEGEFEIAPGSNDIFINSAKGRTIGPADAPSPFNNIIFLDTIKSYINESRSLGWITSQSTADKYTGLFGRAKADIQAAKVPSARARLDTVLMQVHTDSGVTLTSESYALLRFNTEYLGRMLAR